MCHLISTSWMGLTEYNENTNDDLMSNRAVDFESILLLLLSLSVGREKKRKNYYCIGTGFFYGNI